MDPTLTLAITNAWLELFKSTTLSADHILKNAIEGISENISSQRDLSMPSQEEVKIALSEAYVSGQLILVLGAGSSADYGLPTWNTLLQALLAKTFQNPKSSNKKAMLFAEIFSLAFDPSPLIAARYLAGHYSGKQMGLEKAVRELLYQHIKKESTSDLMKEIVQLAAAPGKPPNLDSIITYNFDDILETELGKSSVQVPFCTIFDVGQNPQNNELPIFHVHGYIPREGELNSKNRITLGENVYHQQYTDIYNWSNLVQLSKFRDGHCVFIGTSFTDPNQRRLLDIANTHRGNEPRRHFNIRKRYSSAEIGERLQNLLSQQKEIFTQKVMQNIKFSELAREMVDAVHRFDENDSFSLGVQTIWFDEYPEVPKILEDMRKNT